MAGIAVVPWGKLKGQTIDTVPLKDLGYYVKKAREALADQPKTRFHSTEQAWLEAVQAEMARRGEAPKDAPPKSKRIVTQDGPPPHTDEDSPYGSAEADAWQAQNE